MFSKRLFEVSTVLLIAVGSHHVAAASLAPLCDATTRLQAPYRSLRLTHATRPFWIEIREHGAALRVNASAASKVIPLSQPLRHASIWVHLAPGDGIDIAPIEGKPTEAVRATIRCDGDDRENWLDRLFAVDSVAAHPKDRASLGVALTDLDRLADDASSANERALVTHYRALVLMGMNRVRLSVDMYARAEEQWRELRDAERAQAARLGRIEAQGEDGQFEAVMSETGVSDPPGPDRYFMARIQAVRCGVLQESGRLTDADTCYRNLVQRYLTLGEANEAANTYNNLANIARKQGDLARATRLIEAGLRSASGIYAPMMFGRLHSQLASIHRRTGNVAAAFAELQRADEALASADTQSLIYRAYGRVYEADLFLQVGALPEAYGRLESLWTLIQPRDAGALLPFVAKVLSDYERESQQPRLALFWLRAAELAHASDPGSPAYGVTRLARLQLQFDQGDLTAVETGLGAPRRTPPAYEAQWQLLEAGVALARGQLDAARSRLAALRNALLPLDDGIRRAVLQARYAETTGAADSGLELLGAERDRIERLSAHAGTATLRQVIARRAAPLRREALSIALRAGTGSPAAVRSVWPWVAPVTPAVVPRGQASAAEFDAAVARQLLDNGPRPSSGDEFAADSALFARLAQPGNATAASSASQSLSLEQVQQILGPGDMFLAFADAGATAAVLAVTQGDARVVALADSTALAASIENLRSTLQSPEAGSGNWQEAVARVSSQLFGHLQPAAVPTRIYVAADGVFANVAWSALVWPGSTQALVETTDIVRVVDARPRPPASAKAGLSVVLAPQLDTTTGSFAALPVAAAEAELISASTDRSISVLERKTASREAVLKLLGDHAGWIHLAAHGIVDPERLGHSGLLLETAEGTGMPSFLSWFDILDRGVGAELVVLDACRLDDRSGPGSNLSFAEAITRAGASEVVASTWPVSDAAAALWVPAFYRSLRADPGRGAPAAVRAAQLRLRRSREFAHPYFWSGLQALGHLATTRDTVVAKH